MVDIGKLGNAHIAGHVGRLYAELDGVEAFACQCRTKCGTPVSEALRPNGSGMQKWAFVGDEDGRLLLEPIELEDCLDVLRAVTGMKQSLIVDRLEKARAGRGAATFSSGGRTKAAAMQEAIEMYEPPLHPSKNRALAEAAARESLLEIHKSLSDRIAAAFRDVTELPDMRRHIVTPSDRIAAAFRDATESLDMRRHIVAPSDHIAAAFRDAIEERDTRFQRNLARIALGPFEDLRRSVGVDSISSKIAAALETQFRLPAVEETKALLGTLGHASATKAATHYRNHGDEVHKAIEAINAPWLNIKDRMRSLAGIVELQEIGHVLNTTPEFGILSADRLRPYLGDWRASIDWPPEICTDPFVRSDFYLKRGLDPALTYFPASAFDRALTVAGIKRPPPPRLDDYDRAGDPPRDDEEAGLQRNNAAHDRLQRFETHVRRFIDRMMTAALGENWIKHRVPGPMRQEWQDKRDKALGSGELEKPLIAYADFTDYEQIIVRKDNWEEVFEPVFQRKTSVEESLRRLYPIRVCTMHARIITQDDELFLYSETLRLLRAIGTET